jgi:hypothetical protein
MVMAAKTKAKVDVVTAYVPFWATYRQALCGMAGQAGFSYAVAWPNKPE